MHVGPGRPIRRGLLAITAMTCVVSAGVAISCLVQAIDITGGVMPMQGQGWFCGN